MKIISVFITTLVLVGCASKQELKNIDANNSAFIRFYHGGYTSLSTKPLLSNYQGIECLADRQDGETISTGKPTTIGSSRDLGIPPMSKEALKKSLGYVIPYSPFDDFKIPANQLIEVRGTAVSQEGNYVRTCAAPSLLFKAKVGGTYIATIPFTQDRKGCYLSVAEATKGTDGFAQLSPASDIRVSPMRCDLVEKEQKQLAPLKECREASGVNLGSALRYDGVYIGISEVPNRYGNKQRSELLRFYQNGKVISDSTLGAAKELQQSLTWEKYATNNETGNCGQVVVDGSSISFSLILPGRRINQRGVQFREPNSIFNYNGVIMSEGALELNIHSLSTGNKIKKTYTFHPW